MNLPSNIVTAIDTGACEASIVHDILEWTDSYTEISIRNEIKHMLSMGFLEDRGAYLVYMYKDPAANEYVYK